MEYINIPKNKSTAKLGSNKKGIQELSQRIKTKIVKKKIENKSSPFIKNYGKNTKNIIKRGNSYYNTKKIIRISNIMNLMSSMKPANIKKNINKNCSNIFSNSSRLNSSKTNIKITIKESSNNKHRKGKSMNFNKNINNKKIELPLEKENRELKRKILLLQKKNYLLLKNNQRYKHLQIQIRNRNTNSSLTSNQNSYNLIDSETNFEASHNYYVTTTGSNKGIQPKEEFCTNKKYKKSHLNTNTCNNSSITNIIYQNQNRIVSKKFSYKPNRNKIKNDNRNKFINIINNFSKNYSYLTIDSPSLILNTGLSKRSGLYNLKNVKHIDKKKENCKNSKTEVKKQFKNINSFIHNEDKNSCLTERNIDNYIPSGKLTKRNNIKKHHSKNKKSSGNTNKNIGCLLTINKNRDNYKIFREATNNKIEGHKYSSSQALYDSMNKIMERTKKLLTSYNNLSKDLSNQKIKKD